MMFIKQPQSKPGVRTLHYLIHNKLVLLACYCDEEFVQRVVTRVFYSYGNGA